MISRPNLKKQIFLAKESASLKNLDLEVHPAGHFVTAHRLLFRPRQDDTQPKVISQPVSVARIGPVDAFLQDVTGSDFTSVRLELCSGHGHWITEMASKSPQVAWIAVEMKLSRAIKILIKAQRLGIKNIWVACCQGQWLLEEIIRYNQSGFCPLKIEQADVHFPDPWPKKRHAHHRLLQPKFLNMLCQVLKPGARLHLVTDDLFTCQALYQSAQELSPITQPSEIQSLDERYGDSYFENLWRTLGRSIYALSITSQSIN